MIILNKKKILSIWICIIIIVVIFIARIENKKESIITVALPINNKTIILDAGHRSEKIQEP